MKCGEDHYNKCPLSKDSKDVACCNCGDHHTEQITGSGRIFRSPNPECLTTVKKSCPCTSDVHEFPINSNKIHEDKNKSSKFLDGYL